MFLKQSTAVTIKLGPFLDETDGKTAETALTVSQADVRLSKNGGNMAQKNEATSLTHDEIGVYDCPLDVTDTNTVGILDVFVHESGALPVFARFYVLEENVYDAWFGASAAAGTDLASILTDTGTTLQGELDGIQADTEDIQSRLPAALVNGRIDATIDGTGMESGAIDAILTRQMTEAYAADGAAPTLAQALFEIMQCLTEFAISGTTITVKKRDGSTTAMTFTLDSATTPTSRTRAT